MVETAATHRVFNQSPVYGGINLFDADPLINSATAGFPDAVRHDLFEIGAVWGSLEMREFARLANSHVPELQRYDAKGNRADQVLFHPAYHALMRRSIASGLHASAWETGDTEAGLRHRARAARLYMTAQAECGHICPMTMTNASLAALRHAPELFPVWAPRILSRTYDRAFRAPEEKRGVTIGMAMTEKQGGTDLRANTTRAERASDGLYVLTGHKWFMSAPMSDAFLVLAQARGGLTCFLMPRILPDGTVNAIRLERLKDKLGNRSNGSAEVELPGARAWRIGEEGRGIPIILDMVTLTRVDCATASAGMMRAGFAEAAHHARYRAVSGRALVDQPLMLRVLSDMALDLAAALALSMRLCEAFDMAPDSPAEAAYARLMTPAVKYFVCKAAPAFLYEAMECLGGNGYVEESALPRLYREAPVNAIWEGSGNVMALDVLRAIRRDDQTLEAVLETLGDELGTGSKAALGVLSAAARVATEDEGSARILTEQLALTAAAAALRRDFPPAFADAFIETRLGRPWRATYGMIDGRFDSRALIDYVAPDVG
ncbi:acyl-CoA dehydrogenase family protein [Propylenella binzhouense]|uniref:DNA alkylation response protein n=1 Tax=Propylenella binzhouense TaxID=2555902 RepID=A0A964WSB7_9HYPH|nr:acyl-CoA dehydrogenase family protein [Propylenella binzhouense]MYZ46686.1 DNA alkylation response protein [Propylenella binzhouense]